jgi:hypothetical protein
MVFPNVVRARLLLSGYSPTDLNADELIEVHPNPFSNSIEGVFYNASQQDLEVRLVNTLGQTIRTSATNGCEGCIHPFSFDGLSSLPVGIYFVEVLTEDGKFYRKVVRNNLRSPRTASSIRQGGDQGSGVINPAFLTVRFYLYAGFSSDLR